MYLHVTPELAGLLAQVFPTLMIALLLEGKLMHDRHWHPVWTNIAYRLRVFTLWSATVSTFVCLLVASHKQEMLVADILATAALWSLLVSMAFLIGHVTGPESPGREVAGRDIPRPVPAAPVSGEDAP